VEEELVMHVFIQLYIIMGLLMENGIKLNFLIVRPSNIGFIARAGSESGGPRNIDILGSNDGATWYFLANKAYPAYNV
jgi:hypothetical protein